MGQEYYDISRSARIFALLVVVSFLVHLRKLYSTSFVSFSVFWDLYCAAPERRDTHHYSTEAKTFHDFVSFLTFSTSKLFRNLTFVFQGFVNSGYSVNGLHGPVSIALFLMDLERVWTRIS